jgi:hypothetical protein
VTVRRFENQGTDFHNLARPAAPEYDVQRASEQEREARRVKTDFQTLKRDMPQWIKPQVQRTFVDNLIDFATPFLIFLMMFSITFFLLDVRFIFDERNDVSWRIIAIFLLIGIVALNRLIARDGSDESLLYIIGLVGVTAFATLALSSGFDTAGSVAGNFASEYGLLFNTVLVALLWWTTNRLTHECCVDENRVAGDMGILTGTLRSMQRAIRVEDPEAAKARAEAKARKKRVARRSADHILERMEIEAYDPTEARPEKAEAKPVRKPAERLGRRHPGISILLFAIPAMAVFALGLPVLMQGGRFMVLAGHAYVALYTFSSLMLLMLTSLGGLRQYFRSRRIGFSPSIAVFWMGLGTFLVLVVMFGAVVLPKPGMPEPARVAERIVDPWRRGPAFQLRFAAGSAAEAAEHGRVLEVVGTVVLAGLGLFVLYSVVRLAGLYAASVGRHRDWYPEPVVRLFNAVEPEVAARAELLDPDLHPLMPLGGLGDVGAEQPVPPRQVEAVVRVGLARVDGMVDAVHVGRDDDEAQDPVHRARQVDIGVVEECAVAFRITSNSSTAMAGGPRAATTASLIPIEMRISTG